jgi:L-arabinose transport system substrate-binding protein
MTPTRRRFGQLSAAGFAASLTAVFAPEIAAADAPLKVGFIVKMPEQAWFINEQAAAATAGKQMDVIVVKLAGSDGEMVMSAIDNLAAQGAKGFVICPPDVKLGPAIYARATAQNMKVVTVDDQFLGLDGKPMPQVPHLGMSGYKIGLQVGQTIVAEMKHRGWNPSEVAALRISDAELPTAVQRTNGATDALIAGGFDKANIFDAPQRTTDTEGGETAASPVFARHANFKKWVIYALNEESVLGGVRASEAFHLPPTDVIGVGINGTGAAFSEFSKPTATGFYGTIAVSSTMHGRQSFENLVAWIKDGKQPPADTQTTGRLMTRDNWQQVKQQLGI